MILISSAHAQEAAAAIGEPSAISGLLPLLLIFAVFYFLLIRPQQKKFKQHQAMVAAIAKGDKIITSGGILGTVIKVEEDKDLLHVEVADGVKVKVVRSTIASVVTAQAEATNDNKTEKKAA